MSWLKRIKPITLFQSSDVPYVMLEDGVRLCFSNIYEDHNNSNSHDQSEHYITFEINKNDVMRQSTNYYKIRSFPVILPFAQVVSLGNTIIEGKLIRHAQIIETTSKKIGMIKDNYLTNISDEKFQNFVDILDIYDHAFLLFGDDISPQARLLGDLCTTIYHEDKNWGRTCVAMADKMCPTSSRKYNWTKIVPDLNIDCYGLETIDNMDHLQTYLEFIGLSCSVAWEK